MLRKLRDQRGETLVEIMASVVIAALSVALLFACVVAATRVDRMAQRADEAYYRALTAAETQTGDADYPEKNGTVTVRAAGGREKELEILLYGGEGMYAYARAGEGAGP